VKTIRRVKPAAEQCSNCKAYLAADQRYCLVCGARCGEPRLPFMDAVTFMNAMKATPEAAIAAPPKRAQRRLSPNAALIASIGTLLLAMGVGVLIGRSNNTTAAAPQAAAPIVIKGNGAEESATASTGKTTGSGAASTTAKKQKPKALKKEAETQAGAEEVLKPSAGVKLPPATVKPGGKCENGAAGCKHGEFTGEFFGE
jgi:hypothetical protein